jgi:hypothetical protein
MCDFAVPRLLGVCGTGIVNRNAYNFNVAQPRSSLQPGGIFSADRTDNINILILPLQMRELAAQKPRSESLRPGCRKPSNPPPVQRIRIVREEQAREPRRISNHREHLESINVQSPIRRNVGSLLHE